MNGIPAMLSSQAPLYLPEDLKVQPDIRCQTAGIFDLVQDGSSRFWGGDPPQKVDQSMNLQMASQVGDSINVWGRKVADSVPAKR